jgi:hypothetical protein
VALVYEAAGETRITSFKPFRVKKIIKLVVTSNTLTHNFVALVTNGLGLDVACGLPVGPQWPREQWAKKNIRI